MDSYVVEMLIILDSLFHKVVDTTNSPIVVEDGGGGESRTSNSGNIIWLNDLSSGCFWLHMPQNVATSIPSLTSQSCGDSLSAVCLARQVGAIYRPPKHQWSPDRPVNEASVKADR